MSEMTMRHLPFVAVEITAGAGAVALAVFVITFALVCAMFWLLRSERSGPQGTAGWQFNITRRLPVSKSSFDRIEYSTRKAAARSALARETLKFYDGVQRVRNTLARVYQISMIVIGLCGIAGSIALFRQADGANMLALPAGILLLLSLGALGSGLIPSRTVDPVQPLGPELFKNIRVQVSNTPLTIDLRGLDLTRVREMMRRGASSDEVVRSMCPDYDELGSSEKSALQRAVEDAVKG